MPESMKFSAVLWWDILFVVILLFFTLRGARRGLVLTLCSFGGILVAFAGAHIASDLLAPALARAWEPKIIQSIHEVLTQSGVVADWETEAEQILTVLRQQGGIYLWVAEQIEQLFMPGFSEGVTQAITLAASAVAVRIARGILSVAVFFLILTAWKLISHIFDFAARLPLVRTLNHAAGGLLGFFMGFLLAAAVFWVLHAFGILSAQVLSETCLIRFFLTHIPSAWLA